MSRLVHVAQRHHHPIGDRLHQGFLLGRNLADVGARRRVARRADRAEPRRAERLLSDAAFGPAFAEDVIGADVAVLQLGPRVLEPPLPFEFEKRLCYAVRKNRFSFTERERSDVMTRPTHDELYHLMNRPGPLWLAGIDLSRFNLTGADLTGSNPRDAQVSPKQLESAKSLEDAIMPDGKKYGES